MRLVRRCRERVDGRCDRSLRAGPGEAERARRIATDHDVWVAVASFAGSTGGGFAPAAGHSAIWASNGVVIAHAGPEPGVIARATLSRTRHSGAAAG